MVQKSQFNQIATEKVAGAPSKPVNGVMVILHWKFIALDLDGTTLRSDHTVAPATRKWLLCAQAQGVPFTFATGRHWTGMVSELVTQLGIDVPVVTSNGAEVRSPSGVVLVRRGLDSAVVQSIRNLARELGLHYWGATFDRAVYEEEIPEDVRSLGWLKFGVHGTDEEAIAKAWATLREQHDLSLTNSHPLNIEINALGATKAAGLDYICKVHGISPDQLVAIGDSLNDVSMLQFAGLGIAMGNAQQSVKATADFVTRSCDEDGVGYAIATRVLGRRMDDME